MVNAVQDFFVKGELLPNLNATNITLIQRWITPLRLVNLDLLAFAMPFINLSPKL